MANPPDLQSTLEKLTETLGRTGKQVIVEAARAVANDLRTSRREAKRQRRAARRQRAIESATVPGALLAISTAVAMAVFAVTHLSFWWLFIVAFAVASQGARQLADARAKQHAQWSKGLVPAHEIDALCDQLLSDLKASPEAVRAFVQQPEKTVEALRVTAKAVDQRRSDLAAQDAKGQLGALEKQRRQLKDRRDSSSDFEARNKFDAALRSLDGQEAALRQLATVSDRLDGEYTSLLVLLQEMKTRVAVARSTSSSSAEGLEQNVQRINAELQAITESLHLTSVDEGATNGAAHSRERVK
jgi:hypothetical protein